MVLESGQSTVMAPSDLVRVPFWLIEGVFQLSSHVAEGVWELSGPLLQAY